MGALRFGEGRHGAQLRNDHARDSHLLLRRKYVRWRCALVCERLRCEPWRPWGWGETTRGAA